MTEEYECLNSSGADVRRESLDVLGEIRTLGKWRKVHMMIDSGATCLGFIDATYAKARLIEPPENATERSVRQRDIVPTLSLLLGIPIPFNSLGTPINEAFAGVNGND
jgi:hypothetical protein